ncbi:MAG: type VI secretion system tip protein VgrG [Bacteroidia bacterium]|nr:type VI secretion system tip protein VgrG [Bacteroidia bacterium]
MPEAIHTSSATRKTPYSGVSELEIRVEGETMANVAEVISCSVRHELNRVSRVSLTLKDVKGMNGKFAATQKFIPGNSLKLTLTLIKNSDLIGLFEGIITEAAVKLRKGNPVLCVEARDVAVRMTQGRACATFNGDSDEEALEKILDKYQIQYDLPRASYQQNSLVQFYASDWDFLLSRTQANGWVVSTEGGQIRVFKPEVSGSAAAKFTLGVDVVDFEGKIYGGDQFPTIQSKSWNSDQQEETREEFQVSKGDQFDLNGNSQATLLHGGNRGESELKAWSEATGHRLELSRLRGRVLSKGIDLKPGDLIELVDLGEIFEEKQFVSGIFHEYSQGQWLTHTQFGLDPSTLMETSSSTSVPASGLLPGVQGLQIGIVDKLEGDPNKGYRIRVRLPIFDRNQEGIWARVLQFDAGNDRGAFFFPCEGEEVILGFLNGDPRDAIVLGSLYHQNAKPPFDLSSKNANKGWFGKNGLEFTFEEEKNIIEIKTQKGNRVSVSEDDGGIIIQDQNQNKIELNDQGINLKSESSLTVEATGKLHLKGNSIQIEAQTNLKAKGSLAANFESDGQTVVKGSMVMIN